MSDIGAAHQSVLKQLEIIEQIDGAKMLKAIEDFPDQCEEAVSLARTFELTLNLPEIRSVLICGLGGSGIGGDIVKAVLGGEADFPVVVNKGYGLPSFANGTTLCIFVSYSGNTEETLACFEQAVRRGCPIIVVSRNGRLADRAVDERIPWIQIPSGLQPRAALGYLTLPILVCLERLNLIRDVGSDLAEATRILRDKRESWWRHNIIEQNPAQMLAMKLTGKLPVIYGSEGAPEVAALRWKCQFNENAKIPAFWNVFPELNHNETQGWEQLRETTASFSLIILRDKADPDQVKRRIKFTRELIEEQFGQVLEVWAEGESRLARILSLMYYGDFVSTYLAILNGVDPTPVQKIETLKKRLKD